MVWDEDAFDWDQPIRSHDKKPFVDRVWGVIGGWSAYWTLVAALDLGLFDALEGGPLDADGLANAVAADPERTAFLADTLVGLGFLDATLPPDDQPRSPVVYTLNLTSRILLTTGSERYMGDLIRHSPGPPENWSALADTVRGADPPVDVDADGGQWHATFAPAAFPTQLRQARFAAARLGLHEGWSGRVLDLGAGAAPWTVGFLEGRPGATAVVNDLPAVLRTAERSLELHGLADRVELRPGDYHSVALEDEGYDLVVLANVVRNEGPELATALLRRAHDALRPGGRVVVVDYLVDELRHAPVGGLLLGMTMLAATRHGRTWRRSEHLDWLLAAGFTGPRLLETVRWNLLLTADRPREAPSTDGAGTD